MKPVHRGNSKKSVPPMNPILLRLQPQKETDASGSQKNMDAEILTIFELAHREIRRRYSKKPRRLNEEEKATLQMMEQLAAGLLVLISIGSKPYSEDGQKKISEKWAEVVELVGRFNPIW